MSEEANDSEDTMNQSVHAERTLIERVGPLRPLLPILAFFLGGVILALFRLQGSSVGVYDQFADDPATGDGVLLGRSRPIRSDEWLVRTPWVLRQTVNGFDRLVPGGIGEHDVGLLADLPVLTWQLILRPHQLGYFVLPTETAFALEWWAVQAVQFSGVYLLLYVLTRRIGVASLCAALVTFSPASQWWTGPATFLTLGYGCLAGALCVLSVRNSMLRRRIAYGALAAWAGAAFAVTLYPPWQIPVALTVLAAGAAAIARDCWPGTSRAQWLRLATTLTAIGLGTGTLALLYVLDHRETISTISSTIYPGQRVGERGGSVAPELVFGGALDSIASDQTVATVNGTNQSENSSGLYFILPVAIAAVALLGTIRIRRSHLPLISLLATGVIFTSWMLLPLPSTVGSLALLNRVPPSRLLLPTVLVGALLLGVLIAEQAQEKRRLRFFGVASIFLLFAGVQLWAAGTYTVNSAPISQRDAALLILVVSVGAVLAISLSRPEVGLAILAGFTLWQAVQINPLQVGIPELLDGDVRDAVDRIQAELPVDAGWMSYTSNLLVRGALTASGVNALSAVSPYPDEDAFSILDPTRQYEDVWNRYAFVYFAPGLPDTEPSFLLNQPDSLTVTLNPCDPRLDQLGVEMIVAENPLNDSCVALLDVVESGDARLHFYRRQ